MNIYFAESAKMLKALCFLFFFVIAAQALGTHDPQFKKPVPCQQLTPGNYVWGCSRFYSMCANGFEHTMHCFDGLVLNPDNNQCEDPRNVWVCQNQQPGALYRAKTPFTCQGKPDGDYEAGVCSSHYYQCHAGNRFERECSVTLVYNPAVKGCDFPSNCKHRPTEHSQPINIGQNWTNKKSVPKQAPLRRNSYGAQGNPAPAYVDSAPAQAQPVVGSPSTPVQDTFIVAGQNQPKVPQTQSYQPANLYNDEPEQAPQQAPSYNAPVVAEPQQPAPSYNAPVVAEPQQPAPSYNAPVVAEPQQPAPSYNAPVVAEPQQPAPSYNAPVVAEPQQPAPSYNAPVVAEPQQPAPSYNAPVVAEPSYQAPSYNAPVVAEPQQPAPSYNAPVVAEPSYQAPSYNAPVVAEPSYGSSYGAQEEPVYDCTNKVDGVYLINPSACTKSFWKCANSRAFEYSCPTGLFYDVHTNQCNHQEFVPTCGGQISTTTSTVAPKTNAKPYNCAGKADGYYQHEPCSQTFYSCNAGYSTALTCSPGTVFDTTSSVCEYPADCGKPKNPPSSSNDYAVKDYRALRRQYKPTAPVQDAPYGNNKPVYPVAPVAEPTTTTTTTTVVPTTTAAYYISSTVQSPKAVFNCTNKADGYYYKKKCSSSFIICSKGQLSQQVCPEGLLFDPNLVVCNYKDECGKSQPTTTTPPPTTTADSYIVVETTPAVSYDCTGKTDGYHASQPCTSTFFACASNVAIQLSCPPTLVFDPNTLVCDFPNVCGTQATTVASPTTTTTQAYQKPAVPSYQKPVASSPYVQQPYAAPSPSVPQNPPTLPPVPAVTTTVAPAPPAFNCQGRLDGYYYTQPCSNTYFTCVSGQSTQIQCPASLVFDPTSVACEYANVCGQPKATTTTPRPAAPAVTYPTNAHVYGGVTNAPAKTKKSFSCANRSDGFYLKKNCASSFFTCTGGVATKTICPAGLVLDVATGTCEYPESCGKTVQKPVPVQSEPVPVPYTSKAPVKFDCAGKDNGQYPVGHCQSNYVVCSHGVAHSYSCPVGLVYDEKTNICQYADQCGVSPVAPQNDQSYVNVKPIPVYQKVTTEAPVQAPAAVASNCGAVPIGTHAAAPCSPQYISCSNGRLTQGVCFGSLVYNQVNGYCDSPQNVPACNAVASPPVAPAAPYVQEPVASAPAANQYTQRKFIRKL